MRTQQLLLLLGILFSTCVRAQNILPVSEVGETTNIAFIKPVEAAFPADSITIRTSLDTLPYGFAFNRDTMFLDIAIFPPVEEVTVELLSGSKSFGRYNFWVDAPSANVHLSVQQERTRVDSVTLSGVDKWYREKLKELGKARSRYVFYRDLVNAAAETGDNLMAFSFMEALLNQPAIPSSTLYDLKEFVFPGLPFLMESHPRFEPLKQRALLLNTRPINFRKTYFINTAGKPVKLAPPVDAEYYVLDMYSSEDPRARRAHQQIKTTPALDSLFTRVAPMVSVSNDPSPALWGLYVKDNAFGWSHYIEDPASGQMISEKIKLYRRPLYLLMNRKHRVEGVFLDLQSLVNAVHYYTGG